MTDQDTSKLTEDYRKGLIGAPMVNPTPAYRLGIFDAKYGLGPRKELTSEPQAKKKPARATKTVDPATQKTYSLHSWLSERHGEIIERYCRQNKITKSKFLHDVVVAAVEALEKGK